MSLTLTMFVIQKYHISAYYFDAKFVLEIVGKCFIYIKVDLTITFLVVTININPCEEMRIKNSPILVSRY